MRATEVLTGHHQLLRGLITRLGTVTDAAERHRVLGELVAEFTWHARIEDEIFYPAVRDVSASVVVAHAEHRQMDDQLAALVRAEAAGVPLQEPLRTFAAHMEQHARIEEEHRMFPEVESALGADELQRLAVRLTDRLTQLRHSRLARWQARTKTAVLRHL
jgi:hypothetical protein